MSRKLKNSRCYVEKYKMYKFCIQIFPDTGTLKVTQKSNVVYVWITSSTGNKSKHIN